MVDISSGIQGTFNQANLAARRVEAEKAQKRRTEEERLRDARRKFVLAQEEIEQTETLRGSRVDADKQQSDGRDARDQHEAHDQLASGHEQSEQTENSRAGGREEGPPPDSDSGHLIDVEA